MSFSKKNCVFFPSNYDFINLLADTATEYRDVSIQSIIIKKDNFPRQVLKTFSASSVLISEYWSNGRVSIGNFSLHHDCNQKKNNIKYRKRRLQRKIM